MDRQTELRDCIAGFADRPSVREWKIGFPLPAVLMV
jgi:hypothetical protein